MIVSAITLSLQLQRTSFDLLDGLNIEVVAHNSAHAQAPVRFPAPAEYAIDVLHDRRVIWTTQAPPSLHAPVVPEHTKELMPGPTVLAIYVWDELTKDHTSITPGDYMIRARMLADGPSIQSSIHVHFIAPAPVSALAKLKAGDEVTIAGRLNETKMALTDSTGTIALTRRLLQAPDAPVAVRGYITILPNAARVFSVERWAPLGM